MRRLLLTVAFAIGLAGCTGLFFQPHRVLVMTPERLGLSYENVTVTAADGTALHAWFLPARGRAHGTIFFLHGNAENISTHIGSVYWLPEQGFNVFLLDYRGYGASGGRPSLPGVQQDIEAGLRALRARRDVDPARIAVFGQSLGGALAVYHLAHSAQRDGVRALVVESAFASYRAITREKLSDFWLTWPLQYPLSWTVDDDYSPVRYVERLAPLPLLVIHGDQDAIVPLHHGRALYEAAAEPKEMWVVSGGRHIEALRRAEYRARFVAYLKSRLEN